MVDEDSYWIKGLETTEAAGRRKFCAAPINILPSTCKSKLYICIPT